MNRVVLDANVLVSGIRGLGVRETPPTHIIRAWFRGAFVLLTSEHIRNEVQNAMSKPYFVRNVSPQLAATALDELGKRAEIVEVVSPVPQVATHWQDDLVLAAAQAGKADYLVTGDGELLALGTYGGISIVTVTGFV